MTADNTRPLSRQEAADYCTGRGFKVARGTLDKLACIGGGPDYQRFGKAALYYPAALDRWIATRLTVPSDRSPGRGRPDGRRRPRTSGRAS